MKDPIQVLLIGFSIRSIMPLQLVIIRHSIRKCHKTYDIQLIVQFHYIRYTSFIFLKKCKEKNEK